jgi:hypothetical protein
LPHGGSSCQRLADRLVQLRLMAAGQDKPSLSSVLIEVKNGNIAFESAYLLEINV